MGYKCIVSKIKQIALLTCVPSLWKRWIPKGNSLVANANPAKSRIIPNQHRKSKKAKGKDTNAKRVFILRLFSASENAPMIN